MKSDPQNPFAAAAQPATNGAPSLNPFQTATPVNGAAPAETSPFAGVGTDTPFGLVDSSAGRPAKLPERRFPTEPAGSAEVQEEGAVAQSPFEKTGGAQEPVQPSQAAPSPFEAVVGGPSEGFLAEPAGQQPQPPHPAANQARPQQFEQSVAPATPPVPAGPAVEAPVLNGATPFAVPAAAASQAFSPASAPPAGRNGNNGSGHGAFAAPTREEFAVPAQHQSPRYEEPVALKDVVSTPERAPEAAPAQEPSAAPQAAARGPQNPAPQGPSSYAHGGTPQLVLRAIFGVNHELSADEMLQRARTLPGVRNLSVVGPEEAQAMRVLRGSVSRMGFGDEHSIALSSAGGDVDIIEDDGTTLAVLHEDGGYAAGVRETLIIVTRELSRLSS